MKYYIILLFFFLFSTIDAQSSYRVEAKDSTVIEPIYCDPTIEWIGTFQHQEKVYPVYRSLDQDGKEKGNFKFIYLNYNRKIRMVLSKSDLQKVNWTKQVTY